MNIGIIGHGSIGRFVRQELLDRGLLFLWCFPTMANAASFDEAIEAAVRPLTTFVSDLIFFTVPILGAELPLVVLWLVIGANNSSLSISDS